MRSYAPRTPAVLDALAPSHLGPTGCPRTWCCFVPLASVSLVLFISPLVLFPVLAATAFPRAVAILPAGGAFLAPGLRSLASRRAAVKTTAGSAAAAS